MSFVNNLKGYKLAYTHHAKKAIDKLPHEIANQIHEALDKIVDGQQNLDIKKLHATRDHRYRLRVGDYRVIYAIFEEQVLIHIIDVGHRKEIYRKIDHGSEA